MDNLHKILQRQIRKHLGNDLSSLPSPAVELLKAISAAYYHYDEDRALIERSLEISSRELTDINRNIEAKVIARTEELANQQRTIETLLDNLPVGVFVAKVPNGEPSMINNRGVEILGRGMEPGINSSTYSQVYKTVKEDGSPYPNEELPLNITLREGKTSRKDDLIIMRPNGEWVPLRVSSAPIKTVDGHITSAVAVFEDITKERQLERSRDEFFSIASHELRTPLTAIRGNAALIEEHYPEQLKDPMLAEMIGDIHESSARLISIVNDFLDTSRLEQRRMKFLFSTFDIVELAEKAIRQYQVTSSRKQILLQVQEPPQPLPAVYGDEIRTRQVLINLVGNAMKFTQNGSVTVSFANGENFFIKVLVRDTGVGMTPEAQQNLFKKFEQAGQSVLTRDSVRGTGLGLYISKMMVEQMGGHINLESSQLGIGTTFAFTLPVKSTGNTQPQKENT